MSIRKSKLKPDWDHPFSMCAKNFKIMVWWGQKNSNYIWGNKLT